MDKRKDFKEWQIDLVFKKQLGACAKCGKSIIKGFIRDHLDGDCSNNSVENLRLLCAACSGGEQYATLIKQKKKVLSDVESLIQMGIEGKLSGAATDKLLDAVKLGLSLAEQVYDAGVEKPSAVIRMESYLVSSGILLKEYEKGFKEGMLHASEAVAGQLLKLMVANKESAALIQLLSKKVEGKKK